MSLWVPPTVSRELMDTRLRDTAERLQMVEMDTLCHQLTLYCHDFDPKVSVVKAKPHATAGGMRPGFYHIMRFNENAPLSFTVIEAKDGGFQVPDSSIIDRLRRTDLWNERV